MKITIPRTFDFSILKDSKTYKENVQFFDWVNSFTDTIVRGLTNQITIADNIDSQVVSQDFTSGTALKIPVKGRTPKAVVFGGADTGIANFFYSMDKESLLNITVTHSKVGANGLPAALKCNFLIFF